MNEVDSWMIYDNSGNDREEIAVGSKRNIRYNKLFKIGND